MAMVFAIMHYITLIFILLCLSIPSVFSFFNLVSILDGIVDDTSMYLYVALCALLTAGVILKGKTLRKCVSDVCVCMFYVCDMIGFVDRLDKEFIYEKCFERCICL